MTTIKLIFFGIILSFTSFGQETILYDLPEAVKKQLKIGMKKTAKIEGTTKNDLSISIGFKDDHYTATLVALIEETPYKAISQKSNRYIILEKNIKIPVVFDFETHFCPEFIDKNGVWGGIYLNGYTICFTLKGEILSANFTQ